MLEPPRQGNSDQLDSQPGGDLYCKGAPEESLQTLMNSTNPSWEAENNKRKFRKGVQGGVNFKADSIADETLRTNALDKLMKAIKSWRKNRQEHVNSAKADVLVFLAQIGPEDVSPWATEVCKNIMLKYSSYLRQDLTTAVHRSQRAWLNGWAYWFMSQFCPRSAIILHGRCVQHACGAVDHTNTAYSIC